MKAIYSFSSHIGSLIVSYLDLKRVLGRKYEVEHDEALSGLGCGFSQAVLMAPFSTLAIKKITSSDTTTVVAIYQKISKGNKFTTLLSGCGATALRNGSYFGGYFPMRELLIKNLKQLKIGKMVENGQNPKSITPKQTELSGWEYGSIGALASLIGLLVSIPFDVISKDQRNSNKPKSIYKTGADLILNEKGKFPLKPLYRGCFSLVLPRMILHGAAISLAIRLSERIFGAANE